MGPRAGVENLGKTLLSCWDSNPGPFSTEMKGRLFIHRGGWGAFLVLVSWDELKCLSSMLTGLHNSGRLLYYDIGFTKALSSYIPSMTASESR